MSVDKSHRRDGKLHVHAEMRRLANHTLVKTRNENKFGASATYYIERDESGAVVSIEERRSASREALAKRIEDAAIGAGECAWRANDIMVGKHGEGWPERKALQGESIRHLDSLLWLLNVARKACGLSGKEVKHWSGMARTCKELTIRWRAGDVERYGKLSDKDAGL